MAVRQLKKPEGRRRPFLSDEEIQEIEKRYSDVMMALFKPAPPPRQPNPCRIIDLAAWKRQQGRE
jgi:hypothetical protein